jgi:hypothetical protein
MRNSAHYKFFWLVVVAVYVIVCSILHMVAHAIGRGSDDASVMAHHAILEPTAATTKSDPALLPLAILES